MIPTIFKQCLVVFQGANKRENVLVRLIAVEFVYSNKTEDDDLIVMQIVQFEFSQDIRHYCLL